MIDRVKAHTGTVWSMQVRNNKLGLVTGSADKEVKFWDFEYTVGAVVVEGEEVRFHSCNFRSSLCVGS